MIHEVSAITPAIHFSPEVMEGHPATRLIEASVDADLVVVGSRGHGAFTGMLLGSVRKALRVPRQLPSGRLSATARIRPDGVGALYRPGARRGDGDDRRVRSVRRRPTPGRGSRPARCRSGRAGEV